MSEVISPAVQEQAFSPEFDYDRFSIHVHFSHHDSHKDLANLRKLVKSDQFDIYVPEVPGHSEHLRFAVNSLAQGDSVLYRAMKQKLEPLEDGSWPFYNSIYNAKKVILFPDFDETEIEGKGREKLRAGISYSGDFEKDLETYKAKIFHMAEYFNTRDEHVAETLPSHLQQVLTNHPELQDREKVRVLMSIGVWHTGLSHRLARAGFDVERSFQGWPHTYDYHGEAIRSLMYLGRVDDEVLERGMIEQLFSLAFDCEDHHRRALVHRQLAGALTHEEIVEMNEAKAKDKVKLFSLLEEKLQLDNLLRSPKIKISPQMSLYRKFKRNGDI